MQDVLKEEKASLTTNSANRSTCETVSNSRDGWAGFSTKQHRNHELRDQQSYPKSCQISMSDFSRKSNPESKSLMASSRKQAGEHSFTSVIDHNKTSRRYLSPLPKKVCHQTANIPKMSQLPNPVIGFSHEKALRSIKFPPVWQSSRIPFSRLPVPILAPEVFESPIPAPDFDITPLWEDVRKKFVLADHFTGTASAAMTQTSEVFANLPCIPRLVMGNDVDSSQISTILQVEKIAWIPNFASLAGSTEEQAKGAKGAKGFPAINGKSTLELVDQIMAERDERAKSACDIQEESSKRNLEDEELNHVCHKLQDLRFKVTSEDTDSVNRRGISLDVTNTFANINYHDVIEPYVILGPKNIGATFLFRYDLSKAPVGDVRPYWEQDALATLMMQLRISRPDFSKTQKQAFVQGLHNFGYGVDQRAVTVWMMSFEAPIASQSAPSNSTSSAKPKIAQNKSSVEPQRPLGQPARRSGHGERTVIADSNIKTNLTSSIQNTQDPNRTTSTLPATSNSATRTHTRAPYPACTITWADSTSTSSGIERRF